MDWGFTTFVGTMLFFAALHQWPPDGRRWQRTKPEDENPIPERPPVAGAAPVRSDEADSPS